MYALILAAGRGKRMLPLTKTTPKPMLPIGQSTLIEQQIEKLVQAGIQDIVITLHHLSDQIFNKIGDGKRWGISIQYSREEQLLNTGSGIIYALDKIHSQKFLVVNSDIYTDFPYKKLVKFNLNSHGHLILVSTPYNHEADFGLNKHIVTSSNINSYNYTFSGISLLDKKIFEAHNINIIGKQTVSLASILKAAVAQQNLSGEHYNGYWIDAGTHQNYALLKKHLKTYSIR
jgi:N-acetyl-alpha-D-muramate 1-phosphate uridylyltransferase